MKRRPGNGPPKPDFSEVLREYTEEELVFLRLHAVHGPLVHSDVAAELLEFRGEDEFRTSAREGLTPLDVFRPPNRFKVAFVATLPLAKLMVSRGIAPPRTRVPEPWSFSDDDTAGPEILLLGRPLTAREFRKMTLLQLTELRLHARCGPVMTSAKVAQFLAYADYRRLIGAIEGGRIPVKSLCVRSGVAIILLLVHLHRTA